MGRNVYQILGQELSKEMQTAQEWAGALNRTNTNGSRLFGSKTLGEIELERKANDVRKTVIEPFRM